MTYKEISLTYDIPMTALYTRIHRLEIKSRVVGGKKVLNKKQLQQLLEYNPTAYLDKYRKNNHPRKIKVIEFYQKLGSGNKVSTLLNIHRNVVNAAIREYNETGFCVVESKMNKDDV